MKTPFGIRLWILVVAFLLVAGCTIYGLSYTWHRVQLLETKLTHSQIERFQLASEVRRELQNLNSSLLRYALVRAPQQWSQFEKASDDLNDWIDHHDPSMNPSSPLTTESERRLFEELNHVYDDYLLAARSVHSNSQPALVSSTQLAQLDAFNREAERMRELVKQLTEAHRFAEEAFLSDANSSLNSLRSFLTACVVVLLGLFGGIGWVIYRDTIAPLRTKLVQSQSLLEKQEKLATLGTLAAGIAHEIRNPLTSLKARLYTLEKHLGGMSAARKDTEIIGAEISRLERIVQDVLSFARPSDPKLKILRVETLLQEVRGLMSPGLESQGIQLVIEPTPELFVRADSGYLKQVLINLARNAAEAIEQNGTVVLRGMPTRAHLNGRDTDAVILEVRDDGTGIPPEVEKRLFDPFFSTKETGTGLGLPIAARIIEKHGGLLQYQTRPGHGTTFGVVLAREFNHNSSDANHPPD